MSEQLSLDDALAARDEGIERVANHNQTFVEIAREMAVRLARENGTVTADDLRERMEQKDCPNPGHYNAWGAVFSKSGLEWTGEFRKSKRVRGHGNLQRVWRLKSGTARRTAPAP